MELRHPLPLLNMYNRKWRIRTAQRHHPPARFMPGHGGKQVDLNDCMVCEGSVIEGARLHHSLISYDTVIRSGAELDQTLLMNGCHVGESVRLRQVLADKNCVFDQGVTIGYDPEADRRRFPFITEQGIVVLPKGTYVPANGPIEFPGDLAELIFTDSATKGPIDAVEIRPVAASHSRYSGRSSGPGAVHRPEV
jgi:glucose-1-phosphate adenylyltransferase